MNLTKIFCGPYPQADGIMYVLQISSSSYFRSWLLDLLVRLEKSEYAYVPSYIHMIKALGVSSGINAT